MEPGYGSIAYTSRQLQQLLQKALEQVFPNCKTKQIPIRTSFLNGQGVFSSGLAFVCAASKGISPAEAADRLSVFLPGEDLLFSKIEKNSGYLNFHPSPRWYTESASFLLRSASFSAWHFTEEDFGFFCTSSPAVAELQKSFVRLCSILRNCQAEGMLSLPCPDCALALLDKPQELALIFSLARLADAKSQSLLPILLETARAFCFFYDSRRVWSPQPHLTAARAALCLTCAAWIQQGLQQTGLWPEKQFDKVLFSHFDIKDQG